MLEVRDLYCGYGGGDVLKGINLQAAEGEFLCVAGPNGCGKSTLLKAIARVLPFRGNITLDNKETAAFSQKEFARHISFLGQVSRVYFPYTVYDTAAMGRYAYRKGWFGGMDKQDRAAVEDALAVLGIADLRDELISELSGGQLQRVFLARTLAQDPKVILLDEPTNHLDIKNQAELLEHLGRWVKKEARAIIAVFHDLNLARRYGDRAALMAEGRIVAKGSAAEVLSGERLAQVYGMDI